MIYREMPATWDPMFRPHFYARWGRESAVISASSRMAEYDDYKQLLSIKAASGGEEEYFLDGQRLAVDDNTFLILNTDRVYSSRIRALRPVRSFSIFFSRGMLDSVLRCLKWSTASLLEDLMDGSGEAIEFGEYLRPHNHSITPVLRHIYQAIECGLADEIWMEEQLHFLLERRVKLHCRELAKEATISSVRRTTRKELHRRLGLAVTFMHSNYAGSLNLDSIAAASRLSRFHFLRTFKEVHGVTPAVYLNRLRTGIAMHLLATTPLTHSAVAHRVGFGGRTTLFRHVRTYGDAIRARQRPTLNRVVIESGASLRTSAATRSSLDPETLCGADQLRNGVIVFDDR